ncbi:MAG: TRAP transporter solute receptor, DctP family [Oscillospiraceae bacterium]|jgi:TRAP-type transport system periplasmic protein
MALFAGCAKSPSSNSSAVSSAGEGDSSNSADNGEVYQLKLANIYAADHPFNVGCQKIVDEIQEKTDGHVIITIYPAAQLGPETAEINNLQAGAIDFAVLGSGEVAKRVKDFNIFDAPYLFKNVEEAEKAAASDVVQSIFEQTKQYGFTVENMLYYGVRNLTTNSPVDSPEDTKNMKLRVPDNNIPRYIAQYVFGAAPTPMALSEVYLALQQGVVQGQENPIPTIYTQKFYEVCDYINLTQHQISYFPTIMSNKTREKLPENYVKIIDEAFQEGAPEINKLVLEAEDELLKEMQDAGAKVHTPANLEAFQENVPALVKQCEDDGLWTKGLYDKIKAVCAQ